MSQESGNSIAYGKDTVTKFLKDNFDKDSEILDVGAGQGTYAYYLGEEYKNIDALDVWEPARNTLNTLYREVFIQDIRTFEYPKTYDLIIFGDILEHLTFKDARKVLDEAKKHSKHILIGVPYTWKQGSLYGNDAENHLQPDLTFEIFKMRYPEFKFIYGRFDIYGYYFL